MIQGSEEWFAARIGKVTASKIKDVISKIKTGEAAARRDYRIQLVTERLTGQREQGYTSPDMQWGTDTEPQARAAYEAETGSIVSEVGMIDHPTINMTGASPDGLVDGDGLLEIKCPKTATHLQTLMDGKVPSQYVPQMQWQMACTGRKWVDFVSFDPRLPAEYQLFIKRVERDDALIAEYEAAVIQFLAEVDATIEGLLNWKKAA
jgi:putative phage-type endonuclease